MKSEMFDQKRTISAIQTAKGDGDVEIKIEDILLQSITKRGNS